MKVSEDRKGSSGSVDVSLPDFLKTMVAEGEAEDLDLSILGGASHHSGSMHHLTGANVIVCRTAPVKTFKISFAGKTEGVFKDVWQHWNIK